MFRLDSSNHSYSFTKLFLKTFLSPRILLCVRGRFRECVPKWHLVDYQNRLTLSLRSTCFNPIEYLKLGRKVDLKFQPPCSELTPGANGMNSRQISWFYIMGFRAKADSLCYSPTGPFWNTYKLPLTIGIEQQYLRDLTWPASRHKMPAFGCSCLSFVLISNTQALCLWETYNTVL